MPLFLLHTKIDLHKIRNVKSKIYHLLWLYSPVCVGPGPIYYYQMHINKLAFGKLKLVGKGEGFGVVLGDRFGQNFVRFLKSFNVFQIS